MESLLCLISAPSLCRAQRLDTERAMSYWLKGQVWVSSRNDTDEAVDPRNRLRRFEPCTQLFTARLLHVLELTDLAETVRITRHNGRSAPSCRTLIHAPLICA